MPDLFASVKARRRDAEEAIINACLSIVITERLIAGDDKAIGAIQGLLDELALRARDLTNLIDDSPIGDRPRLWNRDSEGRDA